MTFSLRDRQKLGTLSPRVFKACELSQDGSDLEMRRVNTKKENAMRRTGGREGGSDGGRKWSLLIIVG